MGPVSLIVLAIAAIAFSAGGILVGKILVREVKILKKGSLMNVVYLPALLPGTSLM